MEPFDASKAFAASFNCTNCAFPTTANHIPITFNVFLFCCFFNIFSHSFLDICRNIFETDFSGKIGIVIGNEGKGISPTVKKECDFMVNIPMLGEVESLNASVSAGIFMYSALNSRRK